ncbi:type II and III secretion system protein family protein [Methylogaea oryzae]|uniref:type II and III secretion system protein family protein n=1 Tax=Methylogaea oryzae TaxID=1295382 RepID=UPI0009EAEC38|nr:type II and III secretion system protein family protein [Methylogaea oryzae]
MKLRNATSCWFATVVATAGLILVAPPSEAADLPTGGAPKLWEMRTQHYQVPLSKSLVFNAGQAIGNVTMGDPSVANVVLMRPSNFLIQGKSLGSTNVVIMGAGNQVLRVLDIEVVHDQDSLKERFHQLMPGEQIAVSAAGKDIILSGEVSSLEKMDMAAKFAEGFAMGGKVHNMMHVGGADQVMLEVKVAEIDRTLGRKLGVSFRSRDRDGNTTFGVVQGLNSTANADSTSQFANLFQSGAGLFANYFGGAGLLMQLQAEANKETGLVKILSEPTLTTQSGKKAAFLSGGEFPIPVFSGSTLGGSGFNVAFKEFGVGVEFLPVVLSGNRINLTTNVSVSELSDEAQVSLFADGTPIKSLRTRKAASTLELSDGQTMSIAGLISDNARANASRIPYLGDIPVLGQLFRSQEYQSNKTELVIFATPHLAKPLKREDIRSPTDYFVAPDDQEFYLMGRLEGRKVPSSAEQSHASDKQGGLVGEYGHTLTDGGAQ